MLAVRVTLLVLCLASCLFQGCSGLRKSLSEIAIVQTEIAKKFGEQVSVHENTFNNSTTLVVDFVNSALNEKSEDERALRAKQTAEIVKARHPSIARIDSIWINFFRVQSRYFVISYKQGISSFGFDRDAQPLTNPNDRALPERSLTPRASYLPAQQTTEVSVELLLEGSASSGVSMFPHFSVRGDATKRPSEAPDIVTFDFASYSSRPKFPDTTNITIEVDNKTVVDRDVRFSASKVADGQVAEFLYLPMPYKTFIEICRGNQLTITIGQSRYAIDRIQFLALKNMNAYVIQNYGNPKRR